MDNIFKDYFDIKNYTRENLRRRKTKIYVIASCIIGAAMIIYALFNPAINVINDDKPKIDIPLGNNIVLIEPPVELEEPKQEIIFDSYKINAEMLARVTWGEARGCTKTEQAAVMWCVLNRVDSDSSDFNDTIASVICQPNQFHYSVTFPLEEDLLDLAYDVLSRWYMEKETGEIDSGRILPKEYCFFHGDGKHNHFRDAYRFEDANTWDWSWDSPYEE
jgi:hypothetical protein